MKKRLSNKKYAIEPFLWVLVGFFVIYGLVLLMGCATPEPAPTPKTTSFCSVWNNGLPGEPPFTPNQNKMMHMGFFLSREDFVRTTMNQHIKDAATVDRAITCYTENIMFLVEEVDELCKCSDADKKEETALAWNRYINDCIREASAPTK